MLDSPAIYCLTISRAAFTMCRAEMPNMSINTVGGPDRGIVGTANTFTITLRWSATADSTASPMPPSLRREHNNVG